MEAGNILYADVLDIIFDSRNKDYGAYDLRKNYQRRLVKSLIGTLILVTLICITYILLGSGNSSAGKLEVNGIVILEKLPPTEKPAEKLLPPTQKTTTPPAIKTMQLTRPLIVTVDPPDNEKPPAQTTLETANIGKVNEDGKDFGGIQEPPVEEAKGIVDILQKHNGDDSIFAGVEIESAYPGGLSAWSAFLYRKLNYPQNAIDNGIQGTVFIQFIVDKDGNVSDVAAIGGPEELREAAVNVIKMSGKWIAAIQNGRKVKSYKKQPVTFKLAPDQ